MNERDAKKQIKALKAFHGHLLLYVVVIGALAVVNFMTHLNGDREIWVVYPLVCWGAFVLLQGIGTYGRLGAGKRWEEDKLRELTGWGASEAELARLSQRAETLLQILSEEDSRELGPALRAARAELLEAKRAITHYRSPLDGDDETGLSKQDVVELIERLEATLTRREFQGLQTSEAGSERHSEARSERRTRPHLRPAGDS